MNLLFLIASILSILSFPFNPLVIFGVVQPYNIEFLWYVGWIFWILGITLITLSYYHIFFRKEEGLISRGVYAVVRHPLYLGWILSIFVATAFLYQHWVFVVFGIPGIASVYLISKQEEQDNIDKFGEEYERYMHKVPGMNLFAGVIRLLRTGKSDNE